MHANQIVLATQPCTVFVGENFSVPMLSFLLQRGKEREAERREGRRKGAEKTSKTHGGTHSVATALSEGEERDTEERLRESLGRACQCLDLPPGTSFTAVKWAEEGGKEAVFQTARETALLLLPRRE